MLKKLSILTMGILIFCMVTMAPQIFAKEYYLGDVNKDSNIDSSDYLLIKKFFTKEIELDEELADVDKNGRITATDYLKLKYAILSGNPYSLGKIKIIETKQEELENALEEYQKKNPKIKFSVGIANINNDEHFFYNGNETFRSGCTIKAPYLWYCALQIQEKNIDWEKTKLKYVKTTEGTSVLRRLNKQNGTTSFSLKTTMNYVAKYSDNDGYRMLVNKFGTAGFNKLMDKIGSSTKIGGSVGNFGTATAEDRVTEWKEIYKFLENNNSKEARNLKKWLQNDSYNYIGRAIGEQTIYMSGWVKGNGTTNDCAVVLTEEPYILTIFTSDGNYYEKDTDIPEEYLYDIAKIVNNIWSK